MFKPTFISRVAVVLVCIFHTFTPTAAADYFWVGGSGDWSDISHWATTSGGNVTHAQAPTSNDDVFFDGNSFTGTMDIVRVNNTINFCRNMNWAGATGNPVFLGSREVTLNVFGSLELINAMDYSFEGKVTFTGPDNNDVDFRGNTAGYILEFAGTGAWRLTGDVVVDSILLFNEGTLRTSGRAVTTQYFRSDGDAIRSLELGASTINITASTWRPYVGAYTTLNSQPLWLDARNLLLNAGSSTINLSGSEVELYFEGPGTLNFNEVVLSSASGSSTIRHWTDQNGPGSEPSVGFARLNLLHRTLLGDDFIIGELELHGGQEYNFQSGKTFTLGNLIANGSCQATIDIVGTAFTNPAVFSATVPITANFAALRAISASGGGAFTVNDAIDLGGNSGWAFNSRPNERFFWIGGTGDWSDGNNWSFSSGGPANGCVPSLADDVFFDGNSFTGPGQTVSIDIESAACRNMSWVGASFNPAFAGPNDNRMQIGGSLAFIPAMDHTFEGNYFFSSSQTGNTITSAGQQLNSNAYFEGGGEWILQDALRVYYELNILSGVFRTNDQAVNVNFFYSLGSGAREIYLSNSLVTLESRQDSFFYSEMTLQSDSLRFEAGNSIISLEAGQSGNVNINGQDTITLNVVNYLIPFGGFFQSVFNPALTPTVRVDSLSFFNSGIIAGYNEFNYLYLAPGRDYELRADQIQRVNELVANGSCEAGPTSIGSSSPDEIAQLSLPAGQTFERLYLRDIEVIGGAPATANTSLDGGGNTGWQINAQASRTLFWVGGEGDWQDINHWSLTSGGVGGECIPTLVDNVVIDGNSSLAVDFTIANNGDRFANCFNINWMADLTNANSFNVGRIRIAGSLTNAGNLSFGASPAYFIGAGDHTITMGGASFLDFVFEQSGTYTFIDDFTGYNIVHQRGTLNFTDQTGDLQRMTILQGRNPKFMNLGDAHLRLGFDYDGLTGAFSAYGAANVTIDPGNSLVELTSSSGAIRADYGVNFNKILFSDAAGNGRILQEQSAIVDVFASTVDFNGNGRIDLELTTDTLLFAPGKSYIFRADADQTINEYWKTIGSNCTPIALQSSINGVQARAQVPEGGKIVADFVQMRNITGVGGADFFAGTRSTNIDSSNVNWRFETAPRFQTVGFLSLDRAICEDETVTLNAFNFSPNETYLWQDGSTDTVFTTNQAGTYYVEVTFEDNCSTRDTIVIFDAPTLEVSLPEDSTICQGDTLVLVADTGLNFPDYLWQDGSPRPTFSATTAGQYSVTVDLGGCLKSDSIMVTVIPSPVVDIGDDRVVACAGEDFTLTANVVADGFMWQDGSTDSTFTGNQPGIYVVEANNGRCPVQDSVEVVYVTPNIVNLGNDSIFCEAQNFVLNAGNPNHGYLWQDGSSNQTFTTNSTGQYSVIVDSAGCTATDTIELTFLSLDDLDIVDGYEICEGETFRLSTQVTADAISWSNGQTGPDFNTLTGGAFMVEFDFGSCVLSKDFALDLLPPPAIDLGPDVAECEGIPVVLDAGMNGVWQDGSFAPTFSTLTDGEFKVVVTDGICSAADSVNVRFLPAPEFSLGEDQETCEGEVLSVSVSPSNAGFITWDDGEVDANRTFTTSGLRFVDVEDADGCITRDSVALTFNAPPVLDLGPDTTVCDDVPFILRPNDVGEGTLTWPDGSNGRSYLVPSSRTIQALLQDDFCQVTDNVVVTLEPCIKFEAYLPNAFSPNYDGINDRFGLMYNNSIEILEYTMEIFDRWGAPVFRSESVNDRWDGTKNGNPLGIGVYVYSIEVTYRDDQETESRTFSGDIMVLR